MSKTKRNVYRLAILSVSHEGIYSVKNKWKKVDTKSDESLLNIFFGTF